MEKSPILSCFRYKSTGFCPLKDKCPNSIAHRRCKYFLSNKCDNKNCAFFHDKNEKSLVFDEEICKEYKETGSCSLDLLCKFSKFHQNCLYFSQGKCGKANKCPFYHKEAKEIIEKPCVFYLKNTCTYGEKCKNPHICPFFLQNSCKYGETCKYSHKRRENTEEFLEKNCDEFLQKTRDELDNNQKDLNDKNQDISDNICCICLEKPSTHAIVPCGHNIYCESCIVKLKFCAKCRQKIQNIIKIYN